YGRRMSQASTLPPTLAFVGFQLAMIDDHVLGKSPQRRPERKHLVGRQLALGHMVAPLDVVQLTQEFVAEALSIAHASSSLDQSPASHPDSRKARRRACSARMMVGISSSDNQTA